MFYCGPGLLSFLVEVTQRGDQPAQTMWSVKSLLLVAQLDIWWYNNPGLYRRKSLLLGEVEFLNWSLVTNLWVGSIRPHLDTIMLQIFWAAVIVFAAYVATRVIKHLVARLFMATRMDENKEKTLAALLNSASRYIIYALAAMLILDLFGVPITALLAGAGIAGLAIGFGAQSLVKDVITGFFILFEDQFHVGDFVEINGTVTGTVEELGLRTTSIREWSGRKFYIANSEIKTIRNFNRERLRAIVTATFPFDEDPVQVRAALEEVCRDMGEQYSEYFLADASGKLIEPPQVYGVTDIDKNDKGAQMTIIALTKPEFLWTVEKMLREMIWKKCNAYGIRLAYPRRVYETPAYGTLSFGGVEEGGEAGAGRDAGAGPFPGQPRQR